MKKLACDSSEGPFGLLIQETPIDLGWIQPMPSDVRACSLAQT